MKMNLHTSELDCRESTKPCENRTGVSLLSLLALLRALLGEEEVAYLVQTCVLGAVSGLEDPEPIVCELGVQWLVC